MKPVSYSQKTDDIPPRGRLPGGGMIIYGFLGTWRLSLTYVHTSDLCAYVSQLCMTLFAYGVIEG